MLTKTVALLRLLETAWADDGKLHWDDFERVTQDLSASDKLNVLRELLIVCDQRGIKLVGKFETFFECTEALSKTARSQGGKISWSEFNAIAQRFSLNNAATLDELSTFCQCAGIQLTNERLAPVVDEAEPSSVTRTNKIVECLLDKQKQNGGRLTFGDFDKILKRHGIANDADEIDEILSVCQQAGIEFDGDDPV
ncbi:MAG: hypothetical protein IJ774_01410, partial [Selenomonadaceae bacterium]|nr:hypothetical protein [Selenomonadaceae bacterium]